MSARSATLRGRLWTVLLVSLLSLLIWVWAARETMVDRTVSVRLRFLPPGPSAEWIVISTDRRTPPPGDLAVNLTVTGSKFAIDRLDAAARTPFEIPVAARQDEQSFLLADALTLCTKFDETGARIVAADPEQKALTVDRIIEVVVPVSASVINLQDVQTTEPIQIDPSEATVRIPERQRDLLNGIEIEVVLDPPDQKLQPGRQQALNARLQLPEAVRTRAEHAQIASPLQRQAKIRLTVESLQEQVTLPRVVVQLAGPPEDNREFDVEVMDSTLDNVTIKADTAIIRQLQNPDSGLKVFALVHVSSQEKRDRITSKRVNFVVIYPDSTLQSISGELAGIIGPPIVQLRITPRGNGPPAG